MTDRVCQHAATRVLIDNAQELIQHTENKILYSRESGHICRVLAMEMLQGAPLTDLAAIQRVTAANPVDAEQTLINALNVWFGSVVMCRTFHAGVVILPSRLSSSNFTHTHAHARTCTCIHAEQIKPGRVASRHMLQWHCIQYISHGSYTAQILSVVYHMRLCPSG